MQAFIDAMMNMSRRTRSYYHLTLSELIETLSKIPRDVPIKADTCEGLAEIESYRGYYADLSINPSDKPSTVGAVLDEAKAALGKEFTGYNGGEFLMGPDTPLWLAPYSMCGRAIVSISYDGVTATLNTQSVGDADALLAQLAKEQTP